ncbi:hypothetical protein EV421DRAFT_1297597 [Armillaria borealis]|uniref:Uncharacterized protein n=1 Tax=Armillaria borealis TaxID=47425 RepID=A0AA39MY05_9AGAR|nr:hypothetical protein EV421DRAFT_1297597 [Armillaria borealis]
MNAAAWPGKEYHATVDGRESSLQINNSGTFLLCLCLLLLMVNTSSEPRLVIVTSYVHYFAKVDEKIVEYVRICPLKSTVHPTTLSDRSCVSLERVLRPLSRCSASYKLTCRFRHTSRRVHLKSSLRRAVDSRCMAPLAKIGGYIEGTRHSQRWWRPVTMYSPGKDEEWQIGCGTNLSIFSLE